MRLTIVVLFLLSACSAADRDDIEPRPGRDAGVDAGMISDAGSIDPCDRCAAQALCLGGACMCPSGYQGNGFVCTKIDPCASQPCGPGATCEVVAAGHACACRGTTIADGETCPGPQCSPCDAQGRCSAGNCAQRFCDGRFGCYVENACETIASVGCTASSAWESCATDADCPTDFYPGGGYVRLQFDCVGVRGGAQRCWPTLLSFGGAEQPPAIEQIDCPPAPNGTSGLTIDRYPYTPGCDTPPCEGNANQSYELCMLRCEAGESCPFGANCVAGYCL